MSESSDDSRPTLAALTYSRLREDIIRAELPPGSKLNMRALCDRFDVSLSPMREALSRLASDGFVAQTAQRGFAVAGLNPEGLEELSRARSWINELGLRQSIARGDAAWEERVLLALHRLNRIPRLTQDPHERSAAWAKAHMEFHRALVSASGSAWITRFCDELYGAAERYRYFARRAKHERCHVSDEHEAIMSAAVARDADRAVALLNAHFQKTADLVRLALNERVLIEPADVIAEQTKRVAIPRTSHHSFQGGKRLMIVDTHTHVFTNDRARYPQILDTPKAGSIPSITEIGQTEWPETTVEALIDQMDRAGVAKATLVQAYFVYEYDNRYTVDSAKAHADRFVPICCLDPVDPTSPDKLSELVQSGGVRGIRFMRGRLPKCTLGDAKTVPLWERIAALKIPLCIHDKVEELPRVRHLLERFPDLKVAFDHGWGHKVGEPPYDLVKPLLDLAPYPNVYVKTAINNIVAARGERSTPRIFYSQLVETFGANRIMWSSNYPAHPKFGSMESRLEIAQQELAFLPEESRRWIFGETALSVWPWLR